MIRRSSARGASALAALVLVAVFGFIAVALSAVTDDGRVAFRADTAALLAQTAASSPKEPAVSLGGASRCKSPVEMNAPSSSTSIGEGDAVVNRCVPGCEYKVQETAGVTKVDATDRCDAVRMAYQKNPTAQAKASLDQCERMGQCLVQVCQEGKPCTPLAGNDRHAKLNELLPRSGEPAQFKYDRDVQAALDAARRGEDITPFISEASPEKLKAFGVAQAEEDAALQAQIAANEQNKKDYQAEFQKLVQSGAGPDQTQPLLDSAKAVDERNAVLNQQRKNLSEANLAALRANASVTGSGINPNDETPGGALNPTLTECKNARCADDEIARQNGFGSGATSQPRPDPRTPALGPQTGPSGGLGSGLNNILGSILGGLGKALGGSGGAAPAQTCSTDPNAYAQQQQQYNLQLQQYNLQLQQYNQQQRYGGYAGNPPTPPTPCTPSTQQQCSAQPPQPPASSCTAGSWKPVQNGACVTSWQCVPTGASGTPKAQLSCQPKVADVGMSIALSYSCTNATGSSADGFSTNNALSGSATATTTAPEEGTTTNVFTLTCANQSLTASAQCTVQIAKPSIVLVANPKEVESGEASTIGWITSGMQSCVVSSPDQADFTERNAANTSVNGTATTSPITASTSIVLACDTYGGDTRQASTTVSVR